jgi:hypothetical protein
MVTGGVLDKFIGKAPAAVMVRAVVGRALPPGRLDAVFEAARTRTYGRLVLCSQLVALMVGVATRAHKSVHAAYLEACGELGVSPEAVYAKLRNFEPAVTEALVRETAPVRSGGAT